MVNEIFPQFFKKPSEIIICFLVISHLILDIGEISLGEP
jgi:hypothetical protein